MVSRQVTCLVLFQGWTPDGKQWYAEVTIGRTTRGAWGHTDNQARRAACKAAYRDYRHQLKTGREA